MDINKERELFEAYMAEKYKNLVDRRRCLNNGGGYMAWDMNVAWQVWQAKAQAVPEWIEYEKQSPRIDGRYQIFINGEQLAADWESPYGFSSAEDGTAFIQELITHWSVLNNDPAIKAQEPAND